MSLLRNAVVAGFKAARSANPASITITRPRTEQSVTLVAIPGSTTHVVEQEGVVVQETKSRDFLVLASELVLGGVQTQPERGDVITENGETRKALATGGEPHWRYTDQTKAIIRIMTKES